MNVMKTFDEYKKLTCNEIGEQQTNLTRSEQMGLRKIQKRINNHEIVVLKTDKSGKLTVMNRDEYQKIGIEKCRDDKMIDRVEHRRIERRLNDHSRYWCKMLNSGLNHDHQDRVLKSKLLQL